MGYFSELAIERDEALEKELLCTIYEKLTPNSPRMLAFTVIHPEYPGEDRKFWPYLTVESQGEGRIHGQWECSECVGTAAEVAEWMVQYKPNFEGYYQ
jgi:hypothetical protein